MPCGSSHKVKKYCRMCKANKIVNYNTLYCPICKSILMVRKKVK